MTVYLVSGVRADQYDGTNGAALVAVFNGTVITEVGNELQFHAQNAQDSPRTATLGQWVFSTQSSGSDAVLGVGDNLLAFPYLKVPALVTATGTATLPGQTVATQQTIDVDISPAMSSTTFEPMIFLRGTNPGLLAGHVVESHTILDANTVRVVVQSGALSPAGSIRVVAHELA